MYKIEMPKGARFIINELNKNGYEACIVGGCVRDSLLGKSPNDWDITTSAAPDDVKRIFRRTVDTGIQHGTVTVLCHGDSFEVTTYRVDGAYVNHRRPKEVAFTTSLSEDLKRRDFTINAMAYNDSDGVIDIFGGMDDLKDGVVRCVGNPCDRFDEDALRILRAVRFAAQLGFSIDSDTMDAMKAQAVYLKDISAERIQAELTKLITSDNPYRLVTAYELGITEIILPEFDAMMKTNQNNPYHLYNVGIHTIKVMENVPKDMVLRYAALLHDSGKPASRSTDEAGCDHFYGHQETSERIARDVLRRLKLDNNTVDRVRRLVLYHDYGTACEKISMHTFRRFLAKLGTEHFEDFICIRTADMKGQSDYNIESRLCAIDELMDMYGTVMAEGQCLRIQELAIGGRDLMELGMKPGRELGDMLKYLLDRVLEEPELNSRDKLTDIVMTQLNK